MTYTLLPNSSSVRRDADGATIPDDPNNADWRAYQAWLGLGNIPTPAVTPVLPPLSIEAWQGISVMLSTAYDPSRAQPAYASVVAGKTNLFAAVEALVTASGNPSMIAYFQHAPTFTYGDASISALAGYLGLTDNEVLAMFQAAAALTI